MHASIATIATTISVTIVIWLLKFDCKIEKKKNNNNNNKLEPVRTLRRPK